MIKYKTTGYPSTPDAKIKKMEVEKETTKCIWIKGHSGSKAVRSNKHSGYENYFDTWQEAHKYILELAEKKVESIRYQLNQANGLLGNIKGMKEEL